MAFNQCAIDHLLSLIVLAQSSAQKLISLPGSRGPVWPVLSCLLAEGITRKDGSEKTIVIAFRSLVGEGVRSVVGGSE